MRDCTDRIKESWHEKVYQFLASGVVAYLSINLYYPTTVSAGGDVNEREKALCTWAILSEGVHISPRGWLVAGLSKVWCSWCLESKVVRTVSSVVCQGYG